MWNEWGKEKERGRLKRIFDCFHVLDLNVYAGHTHMAIEIDFHIMGVHLNIENLSENMQ